MEAALVLEDGRIFKGEPFGYLGYTEGEVVFSTSMTGYQEMCTDPSYYGQILCLTYPLVGNYGISEAFDQSVRPWIAGLVVRQHCDHPSHWSSQGTIDSYLKRHGIPGISGVDTRALTRHIRSHGTMRGVLVSDMSQYSLEELLDKAQRALTPDDLPSVDTVSLGKRYEYKADVAGKRIVVIDCGLKHNILKSLAKYPVEIIVVPYSATAEDILELSPDGVLTSPGPGDPENAEAPVRAVKAVLDNEVPFFGICLGHQILGLAIGATTSKLKFGHRGANHPVKELATGQVHITSQNHGYQVDADSIPAHEGWRVSHVSLNDGSVEGMLHVTRPAFSVQYHPEGSPGPDENEYLFSNFLSMVETYSRRQS